MKLWEILKLCIEKKLEKGNKFKVINIPFSLIIEYDGSDLIYNRIWDDTTTRDTISLCSGEINSDYVKLTELDYFKEYIISELQKLKYSKTKAEELYKISGIEEMLETNPDYVLHYTIDHWIDWINWFIQNKN